MELAIGSPKISHLIAEEQALVRIFRDILNAYSDSRFSRSKGRGNTLSDAEQELVRTYEDKSKDNREKIRFDNYKLKYDALRQLAEEFSGLRYPEAKGGEDTIKEAATENPVRPSSDQAVSFFGRVAGNFRSAIAERIDGDRDRRFLNQSPVRNLETDPEISLPNASNRIRLDNVKGVLFQPLVSQPGALDLLIYVSKNGKVEEMYAGTFHDAGSKAFKETEADLTRLKLIVR